MSAPALGGRAAFITGGSRGFGLAIACRFAQAGAHVAIVGRDAAAMAAAATAIAGARVQPAQQVRPYVADVCDEAALAAALAGFSADAGPLTVLVNNAAVQGPIGELDRVDWDDWTRTIAIDLVAPINLCRLALPGMRAQGYGKIVNISGGGATAPRPRFSAYATAKSGLVRFTETLAVELRGTGIDVNAVAPGGMNTQMLDQVLAAGPEAAGSEYAEACRRRSTGGMSPDRAADLVLFLATAASDGITGRLVSAMWDRWEELPGRRSELEGTDLYTLRRILPKDRGLAWGDR